MTVPQRTYSAPSQLPPSARIPGEIRPRNVRRFCTILFSFGLILASCFVTGTPTIRALCAFIPIMILIVGVELTTTAVEHNVRNRERWRIRRTQIDPVQIFQKLLLILLHGIIGWTALIVLFHTVHPKNLAAELLRFGGGVVLLYSAAAIIAEVVSVLFLGAGYSFPCPHRTPIAARTVGEFWNRRWNILVSAWLHTYILLPVARRRDASLGIFCAFLVSGLFHGWPILLGLGIWPALTMTAFFVIQGFAVLAENRLRIHTWPVPIARLWTWIILLAPSPLFFDPGLCLFGL